MSDLPDEETVGAWLSTSMTDIGLHPYGVSCDHPDKPATPDFGVELAYRLMARLRAALGETGLDLARLELAIHASHDPKRMFMGSDAEADRDHAEAIARAYALGSPAALGEDGDR
jgi:hypothetical protein